MSTTRNAKGQFDHQPGTPLTHAEAAAYARALRVVLAARGLSNIQAARVLNCNRAYLLRILRVQRPASDRFLRQACVALGCSREWLDALAGRAPASDPVVAYLRGDIAA